MNRLVWFEEIERKAELFYRFNSMSISESYPNETSHVDHISRIVEEQLLIPMWMPIPFYQI
jgi:hypothetical protein